ncbi:MAG: oligosaccharide flippase family protein, partial [Spirochaetota bacterium]
MSDKRRIFFSSTTVLAATIIDNLVFFAVSIIIARYLSIEDYGDYTASLGFATFFSTFTDVGINSTLQRMILKDPGRGREHFGNAIIVKSFLALVIYAAMAAALFFTDYPHSLIMLTLVMGLFRIGNEFHMTFYALFDVQQKFLLSAAVKSSFGMLFLLGTIGVVLLKGNCFDFAWIRLLLVIAYIAILIHLAVKALSPSYNRSALRDFVRHAIPFGASVIFSNVFQRIGIVLLPVLHGSVHAGIFTNGYIFFTTLFFIPGNVVRVLLPYLYRIDFKKEKDKFQYAFDIYSKYLLIAGFYASASAVVFAEEIIAIIFGAKYSQSASVLVISSLGIPFVFTVCPAIITALDKQKVYTEIQAAA